MMRDRLAAEQGSDDGCTFAQARIALRLFGPRQAGHVLVEALAAAQRQPEALRKHFAQRCGRLRQDGRMIAVARRRDYSERQLGALQGGPQPGPGKSGLSLRRTPGLEMIGG